MKNVILILSAAVLMAASSNAAETKSANSNSTKSGSGLIAAEAEAAWKDLENASKPPPPPAEWGGKAPTREQHDEFEKFLGERSAEVAAKAKDFYTRFPDHPKAVEAKLREEKFLRQAAQLGNAKVNPKGPESSEDQEFQQKLNDVHRRAMQKRDTKKPSNGIADVVKELESGLRELMEEYPNRPELWQQMLMVADNAPVKEEKQRLLSDIVHAKGADENTIARAKAAIRAVGAVGHPLEMSFAAPDGRNVDIQKMKGKVILVDFWASWCGPCMTALPEVIDLYKRYHEKGFEIVGINMDKNQRMMEEVVHRYQMPWPQYFDGKGWGTKYALEYNVSAIPSVWLVDKKGILRTMEAREGLEKRITELLAE